MDFKTILLALGFLIPSAATAQWVDHPTPGMPRTPDGKPNLSAPTPRMADGKPDLSGTWERAVTPYFLNVAAHLKQDDVLAWAESVYQQRKTEFGRNSMKTRCLPLGPVAMTVPGLGGENDVKIIQTSGVIAMLFSDLTYRQVHMDGRRLSDDPSPSWMGYSVGRWDGDTLIVESNGFTDHSWLDILGHPHTEALHVVERYRRLDFGHLDVEITFADPGA